ncbi:MAG: DNA-directed RNA polymerase subunit H [Candidatus Micrarchaeota archaeon]|nr:DNA-directed RNA polymerase subunit H [Candidatus Micrarchaeota archaeon]
MPERQPPSHELIPQHRLLKKEEAEKVLAEFKVSALQIPKIKAKDAALIGTGAKAGQIVEITRSDGSRNYRLVVD